MMLEKKIPARNRMVDGASATARIMTRR